MRTALLTALITAATVAAAPVLADSVSGTVLAFDRKAGLIVLQDKSVFTLTATDAEAPEGLKAGDMVTISYESLGEDGYGVIDSIAIGN